MRHGTPEARKTTQNRKTKSLEARKGGRHRENRHTATGNRHNKIGNRTPAAVNGRTATRDGSHPAGLRRDAARPKREQQSRTEKQGAYKQQEKNYRATRNRHTKIGSRSPAAVSRHPATRNGSHPADLRRDAARPKREKQYRTEKRLDAGPLQP